MGMKDMREATAFVHISPCPEFVQVQGRNLRSGFANVFQDII